MADDVELAAFPGLTPTDRENLAGGDENFKPHNWEDLKEIIGDIRYFKIPHQEPYLILPFFIVPRSRQQPRNPET